MAKKHKERTMETASENILVSAFRNGNDAIKVDENSEAIKAELDKRGIAYGCWDVPIVENGVVKNFEQQIIVADMKKLAEVIGNG